MGLNSDDYYDLLGVDPSTNSEELRRAFRRLALAWHPDHAGAHAAPTFRKLAAAYAALSDPTTRAAYDRTRAAAPGPAPAPKVGTPASTAGRRAPTIMLSRISGSLQSLLARGIAQRSQPNLFDLYLDEEEWAQGGMAMISMPVLIHCTACRSRDGGNTLPASNGPCQRCQGRGQLRELFSAWLAIAPELDDGARVVPSVDLPGSVASPTFCIRLVR
jgi:molecular chaperone DnaJ